MWRRSGINLRGRGAHRRHDELPVGFRVVGVCHLGPGGGTRLHLASYMTDGMVPPVVIVTRSYGGTSGNRQPGGGRRPEQAIIPRHNQRPVWPSSPSVNDIRLIINITIAGGKTAPSGQTITYGWSEGDLEVTSDTGDEIHAHIGGPGYELPVQAGKPAMGSSIPRARQPRSRGSPS
jgi:hypothetical protein